MSIAKTAKTKFKITFIGDQNVGKTSIISRFVQDSFQPNANPTVGIDFLCKTLQVQGQPIRLQLWDTAGQQRFRSLIPSYIRDANACFIVLDLSVRSSYENLDKWMDFIRDIKLYQEPLIFIIGNKSDIQQKQVSSIQIQQYSKRHGLRYFQVSAKNGTNISNVFRTASQSLYYDKVSKNEQNQFKQKTQVQKKIVINKQKFIQSQNSSNSQSNCRC